MKLCYTLLALLLIQTLSSPLLISSDPIHQTTSDGSSPFPSNFLLGTASSAYQYEGAYLTDGKGLNNWDVFTHKSGHVMDRSNGDVAVDHYHLYQKQQGGTIGIVINAIWFEPIINSSADKMAVQRAQSFLMNWFLDPIIFGKYPTEMQDILGSGLPIFSSIDLTKLQSGLDFIGINHYTSLYVKDYSSSTCGHGMGSTRTEGFALQTGEKDGVPIGEPTLMQYNYVCPQGLDKIVTYLKERYNNMPMFITENGYGDQNNPNATIEESLHDIKRVDYMSSYLDALASTIRKGADVRGYFIWSLLDNFEWIFGYTKRFGLYHVDFATLKRTPKLSATWYKEFIAKHNGMKSLTNEKNGEYSSY